MAFFSKHSVLWRRFQVIDFSFRFPKCRNTKAKNLHFSKKNLSGTWFFFFLYIIFSIEENQCPGQRFKNGGWKASGIALNVTMANQRCAGNGGHYDRLYEKFATNEIKYSTADGAWKTIPATIWYYTKMVFKSIKTMAAKKNQPRHPNRMIGR